MRETLLSWLPASLSGAAVLDAGCGTGALAVEAAQRGAKVTAVDIAGNLVRIAQERTPPNLTPGRVNFHVGDMTDPALGAFDHVVAMDSLIHYPPAEILRVLAALAPRASTSMLATFAPRTPALTAMHAVGKLFPRSDRAPAIEPVSEAHLRRLIAETPELAGWRVGRTARVASSFYISQALELVPR
jgi:magnesium-protoporphyrin O-methyltransferase